PAPWLMPTSPNASMGKLRRVWPDVPRLLQAQDELASFQTPEAHLSVPAFMAWKAFLVTLRAEAAEGEKERCRVAVAASLDAHAKELLAPVRAFIRSSKI